MRQAEEIERGRGLDLLDELQAIRRLAVALELAVIVAGKEARLNSHGEALARLAGELRLEYGKREIFAAPPCHEPTDSPAPELAHNDGLAEYLNREHCALWFGFHPGNVG